MLPAWLLLTVAPCPPPPPIDWRRTPEEFGPFVITDRSAKFVLEPNVIDPPEPPDPNEPFLLDSDLTVDPNKNVELAVADLMLAPITAPAEPPPPPMD